MTDQEQIESLKKQLADVTGDGGSYRTLQVRLDEALQKHKDDAAAHQTKLESALADLHSKYAVHLADVNRNATAELADQQERHARELEQLHAQHAEAIDKLKKDHHAAKEDLKAKFLLPALRDLHARKQADLERANAEEMKKLLES